MAERISLRLQVVVIVSLALIAGGLGIANSVFSSATGQANEVFDSQLQQTAELLAASAGRGEKGPDWQQRGFPGKKEVTAEPGFGRHWQRRGLAFSHHFHQRIVYQVWSNTQPPLLLARSPLAPETPLPGKTGFSDQTWSETPWRFFRLERSGRIVIVGHDAQQRKLLAHEIGEHGFAPLTIGFAIVILLSWLAIGLGLRPLSRLTAELGARSPEQFDPLETRARPRELAVLVDALNGLFARLRKAFANERRFTADAAHELRTPLAALSAQIQAAQSAAEPKLREQRLEQALIGVQRMSRLVEQLLAVARLDALDTAERQPLNVTALVQALCADLAPSALAEGVELALDAPPDLALKAQPDLLRAALRNLIENAVRHSPKGATVEIAASPLAGGVEFRVSDAGAGVHEALRKRLGERFLRGLDAGPAGAGLGLSIVKRIAALHGGSLSFEAPPQGGLLARLNIPA